ncbi:hypothetical protein PHSY_002914 [Pseudozyma hubeiensis SY62]|uniref:RRM domain-containing protein n=1 Tax=Pseudozyma hubeiensis (strain SY62) TaxID=1305764 RepID=R9P287_PSEHS|nr:hypothetical protein PHSY_002914 [Pseudozyma hubeiensis SY62]GAC95339.1 hypothetical protein PHSY_002914 [Pseudozyma hubeiensis SY62]
MAVATTSTNGAIASTSTAAPSPTLFVKNIEGKIKKPELRSQLLSLFSTYGRILDIVATRAPSMRGQAFIVFENVSTSTAALRALQGFPFYGKSLQIEYSTGSKSKALLRRELGSDVLLEQELEQSKVSSSRRGEKRALGLPDDDDTEEVTEEVEGEERDARKRVKTEGVVLRAKGVPSSVEAHVLETLFQSRSGFVEVIVEDAVKTEDGEDAGWTAAIRFETRDNAESARSALHAVQLDPLYKLDLELL